MTQLLVALLFYWFLLFLRVAPMMVKVRWEQFADDVRRRHEND